MPTIFLFTIFCLENPVGSLEEHFRKSLGDEYSKWFHQGGGIGGASQLNSSLPGVMEEGCVEREERRKSGGVEARIQAVKGEAEQEALKAFKEDQDMAGYTGK